MRVRFHDSSALRQVMDIDGDGEVDLEEFKAVLEAADNCAAGGPGDSFDESEELAMAELTASSPEPTEPM